MRMCRFGFIIEAGSSSASSTKRSLKCATHADRHLGHRSDVCPDPDNVKCRGCGTVKPPDGHLFDPKCAVCGNRHELGNKKCREIYRTPYVVKKRQRERKLQEEEAKKTPPPGRKLKEPGGLPEPIRLLPSPRSPGPFQLQGLLQLRGRSVSRGHSGSRARSSSRPRTEANRQREVSWVDKVSPKNTESEELAKLRIMVEKLTKRVDDLEKENAMLKREKKVANAVKTANTIKTHSTDESTVEMQVDDTRSPPLKRKLGANASQEPTMADPCKKMDDFQASWEAELAAVFQAIQALSEESQKHRAELLSNNNWQRETEQKVHGGSQTAATLIPSGDNPQSNHGQSQ